MCLGCFWGFGRDNELSFASLLRPDTTYCSLTVTLSPRLLSVLRVPPSLDNRGTRICSRCNLVCVLSDKYLEGEADYYTWRRRSKRDAQREIDREGRVFWIQTLSVRVPPLPPPPLTAPLHSSQSHVRARPRPVWKGLAYSTRGFSLARAGTT